MNIVKAYRAEQFILALLIIKITVIKFANIMFEKESNHQRV